MPYTTPSTITTGQLVTATLMNNEWAGNISFLANPPACRVFNSAAVSLANNANTALPFNSERWDTDTMHDTVTNNTRLTIKTAGLYIVTANLRFAFNATGYRQAMITVNGVGNPIAFELHNAETASSQPDIFSMATTYRFAVNDFIELYAFQNSGGALNVDVASFYSPEFAATWIGTG